MEVSEQHELLTMWRGYLGAREPSYRNMRDFYLDVVLTSNLYRYGIAFEVFDIIMNGVFDPSTQPIRVPGSWQRNEQAA
ncbi:MAG: hypothetical protein O3A63_17790 [Proteobacteria bacterium]|nr:hypothetical protein [Pseudomonadota bacterium]